MLTLARYTEAAGHRCCPSSIRRATCYANSRGVARNLTPHEGPQLCAKGTSATLGGYIDESGRNVDPTTGNPLSGEN